MQSQNEVIFRDDDIGFAHTAHSGEIVMDSEKIFNDFTRIDELFIKYGVKHTIAVITEDLHKAVKLVNYIKSKSHINIQLHCNTHEDFTTLTEKEIEQQMIRGIIKIREVFRKDVDTFYPPYNRVNESIHKAANKLMLNVSYAKTDLEGYLRGSTQKVINFHYWADECQHLEAALKKFKRIK